MQVAETALPTADTALDRKTALKAVLFVVFVVVLNSAFSAQILHW
jgi:hypothetical protein